MSYPGYGSAKATQTFDLSDTPNGGCVPEEGDKEHTLGLSFSIHYFTQRQPYGEGFAEEPVSEIIEDSYEYELDGVEVEREELDERFGSKWVNQLLDKMIDNAKVSELEPDHD